MVKDRLKELQGSGGVQEAALEMTENVTLRATFERTEVLTQWVQQIEDNNNDARDLLRRLEDINHERIVEYKLQALFQNNTSIGHKISAKLKDLELESSNPETAEGRIRAIQHNSLKTRFQKAFLDNNQLLERYKTVQKQVIKAQLQVRGHFQVSDEEVSLLLEEGGDIHVFTENILAETAEQKRVLAAVEERHEQLVKIERMLGEVRDLFLEMAILVESQKELVDRIEFQAQNAGEYIGRVDLGETLRSKNKYRKLKLYFIIGLVILVVIILIMLFK